MLEWEVKVKREIARLTFEFRQTDADKKVFCVVESDEGPITSFECDMKDKHSLRALLIKHGVMEA